MSAKRKILFVGEGASLAHIVRPLALAKHLDPNRFEVVFACASWYQWLIEGSGFTYYPLPTISGEEFRRRLSRGDPLYDLSQLKEYVDAEVKLFKKIAPDLVVGDFRISLSISTEFYHIPYVMIANAFWSYHSTQKKILPDLPLSRIFGRKLGQVLFSFFYPLAASMLHVRGFNKLREYYNLASIQSLESIYTEGEWTLFVDVPSLAPTENLPDHYQYIGPILEMPHIPLPEWWQTWPKNKPVAYVNLGSTGDVSVLDNIVRSLTQLDLTVILATAQRSDRRQWPENFYVAPFVPGLEASECADIVLYNGGAGTLYQSLASGVPVIGFPSNMDQFLCTSMVESRGAGKLITTDKAKPQYISSAIKEILSTSSYKTRAQELAQEIKQYDATERFLAFVDSWDRGDLPRRL